MKRKIKLEQNVKLKKTYTDLQQIKNNKIRSSQNFLIDADDYYNQYRGLNDEFIMAYENTYKAGLMFMLTKPVQIVGQAQFGKQDRFPVISEIHQTQTSNIFADKDDIAIYSGREIVVRRFKNKNNIMHKITTFTDTFFLKGQRVTPNKITLFEPIFE